MGATTLLFVASPGCFDPIDDPSAYLDVEVACDDASRWAELVDACREDWERDESCAGLVHFEGTLDTVPVAVASRLDAARFFETVDSPSAQRERAGLRGEGRTPYFAMTFAYASMGGELGEDVELGALNTDLGTDGEEGRAVLDDARVRASITLDDGYDARTLYAVAGSLVRSEQSAREQAGRFSTAYGSEDEVVDGCFHIFATAVELDGVEQVRAPSPNRGPR